MATALLELMVSIVSKPTSVSEISGEDLFLKRQKVQVILHKLAGETIDEAEKAEARRQARSLLKAFQPDQACCMISGKSAVMTLARQLAQEPGLKSIPGTVAIPSSQTLSARYFSKACRGMAQEKGLVDNLAKARKVGAAKFLARGGGEKKASKPSRAPQMRWFNA